MQNDAITLAKNWLLRSGIQEDKGPQKGGFNAWFDMDSRKYSYVYSEITGYGITTLLYIKDVFGENVSDKAGCAADWIREKAMHPSGGVRTRQYLNEMDESELYSFESEVIYAFDCGMVLYGLVNLYKECSKEDHLELAKKLADFLLNTMRKKDGLFTPIFNAKTGVKENFHVKWSTESGSYHAKLALGLVDMFDVTGDDKYEKAAITLCENALGFQEKSGRFITSKAEGSTHLHPHSYSAEGLLYTGLFFGRKDLVEAAARAVRWALDRQTPDGGIFKKYSGDTFVRFYRTDTLAQILRLGVILYNLGVLEKSYLPRLSLLRNILLSFQHSGGDVQKGGFYYGFKLTGERPAHINSWCSMFALQALTMYDELIGGDGRIKKLERFI